MLELILIAIGRHKGVNFGFNHEKEIEIAWQLERCGHNPISKMSKTQWAKKLNGDQNKFNH